MENEQKETIGEIMEKEFFEWMKSPGIFFRLFQFALFCFFTLLLHDYEKALFILYWLFTFGDYAFPLALLAIFLVGNFSLLFRAFSAPIMWTLKKLSSLGKTKEEFYGQSVSSVRHEIVVIDNEEK